MILVMINHGDNNDNDDFSDFLFSEVRKTCPVHVVITCHVMVKLASEHSFKLHEKLTFS